MYRTIALMVAVSAVAFASNANAYEFKPYVGLDYTYSDVKNNTGDSLNSATLNVGTSYNQYFGTELFYQFSDSDKNKGTETSMRAYGLDLYGYLPMGCMQDYALVGTAGVGEYNFKIKDEAEKRTEDSGLGYRLGGGVQYNVDENVSVRALARYIWTDKIADTDHIMEYTVGARYAF